MALAEKVTGKMNGFTADVCYDGESGLDNALSGIYDVMILDVMLPKKDGFTVLFFKIREDGEFVLFCFVRNNKRHSLYAKAIDSSLRFIDGGV